MSAECRMQSSEITEEQTVECECRKKRRDESEIKSLTNRLSRIEGQVRGVRGMLESDAYCIDILTQVSAISSALDGFKRELLANHIKGCVVDNVRSGHDEAVDELILTLQKLIK